VKREKRSIYDWRQRIVNARGRIRQHRTEYGDYLEGSVATRDGYVLVYSQEGHADYRVMIGDVEYSWSEDRTRTKRGLAIMAAKFIERLHDEVTA
jgi:hypothetical protein